MQTNAHYEDYLLRYNCNFADSISIPPVLLSVKNRKM